MRASGKRDLVAGLYVQCLRRAHLHTPTRRSRVLTRSPGSGYPTFDASAPDQEENSQRGLQDENFSPLDSLSINPGLQSVRRQGPEARGRSLRKLAYIFFFTMQNFRKQEFEGWGHMQRRQGPRALRPARSCCLAGLGERWCLFMRYLSSRARLPPCEVSWRDIFTLSWPFLPPQPSTPAFSLSPSWQLRQFVLPLCCYLAKYFPGFCARC